MNITKGKLSRPQRVVIYGAEGVGKSTLAALNAPRPIFLDTEDGTSQLDVERVAIRTLEDLSGAMRELLVLRKTGAGAYESVVLDTADRLWGMCAEAVCAENNWNSIESPGYGRGYAQAAERFRAVFGGFDALMRAGYHVVIVCHAKTDRVTPPDNPEYTKYMIKVSAPTKQAETSREYIKEWCDALLFCHFDVTVDAEKRRALGKEARRVIAAVPSPAWEAKNRLGLPDELPMEAGVLSKVFGCAVASGQEAPSRAPKVEQDSAQNADSNEAADDKNAPQEATPSSDEPKSADTVVKLANGQSVSIPNGYLRVLKEYFVAKGKLADGEGLEKLDAKLADALVARPEQALAAARKWAEAQKGGAA